MKRQFGWGVLLITLLGAFMRFPGLFANTFAADEALFAMWARYIAVWRDPLLFDVPTPVDKPPLLFYLQALFYPLQGPVEWVARMPNFFASILLIPLVGRMSFQLTKSNIQRSLLAAAIVAFSPLAIQFSATAYTDPLLTFFVACAMWCAIQPQPISKSRPLLKSSALWLGIAFWVKYQAILFVPLIWLFEWRPTLGRWMTKFQIPPTFYHWIPRFISCLLALIIWDYFSGRGIDLFSRQVSSYGGIALTPSDQLLPRVLEWIKLFLYIPSWYLLVAIVLWPARNGFESLGQLGNWVRRYLYLFIVFFVLFHWIVNIQPWDRYYLLLVPGFALFVALSPRMFVLPFEWKWNHSIRNWGLIGFISTVFLLQAIPARYGQYPIGGQRWNDHGAAAVAQTIIDEPYGTVLYDHWYSWHWRYHFFYKGVYVEWFGETEELLDNLDAFYDSADQYKRYLALRADETFANEIQNELQAEGYRLELVETEGRIELYVITRNGE